MPPGATKENSKAAVGYDYCSKLFAAERKYAHLSSLVRKTARQVEAEPLLEAYWWWVNTLEPTLGSKLAEAVTYAKNQKEYLNSFLEHGEVDISNNYAENAIRPFTVGRKNWLFCDTPKGADASAIVYTVVETAKANGLEPYRYLKLLLTELPYLGKTPSQEDLMQFLPWSKTMQAACTELKTNINAPRDLVRDPSAVFYPVRLLSAYARFTNTYILGGQQNEHHRNGQKAEYVQGMLGGLLRRRSHRLCSSTITSKLWHWCLFGVYGDGTGLNETALCIINS